MENNISEHNSELDTDSKPEKAAEETHAPDASSHSSWMVSLIVNVARLLLSLTFIFSGFVKAVDPIGTQYKIEDYAEAAGLVGVFPDWMTLTASVLISALEFSLGVFLLFAIKRRTVSKVILAFMVVMTAITAWLWLANPVSDCGCFGDAIHLTNGETFAKNVILLALAAAVTVWPLRMPRFVSLSNQWIVYHYTILFTLAVSLWSLYDLPVFDFRPYHIGMNIQKGMEIPEGEKAPEFESTFIMEKDGVRKEFSLDNYPDSTWTYIDTKTRMVSPGYEPPIHDFSITEVKTGDDITEDVITRKGYTFLLISPHLENADDAYFGNIDMISDYAHNNGYPFYCLTASNEDAIAIWKETTAADYTFCHTDETTLKTIIRSNPGLLLLKDGTIIRKWSHNFLPVEELQNQRLEDSAIGQMPDDDTGHKLLDIFIWFVFPLTLLTIADRLWMWSKWLKGKRKFLQYM